MRIASWNINSIRLRINQVLRLVDEKKIDLLCLQETKTPDEHFPQNALKDIGLEYQYFRGEKSYNGVAIVSRSKFTDCGYVNWCNKDDCRHIYIKLKTLCHLLKLDVNIKK